MILSNSNNLMKISLKKIRKMNKYVYKIDLKDTIDLIQNDFIEYEGCILFNHEIYLKRTFG